MNTLDPKLTALLFNECINKNDIEGLVELMTDNHSLITYGNKDTEDKESTRKAWADFFKKYPDYINHFKKIESRDNFVIISGESTCSNEKSLNSSALWSAIIKNDKVSEWQVYEDTDENRKKLKFDKKRRKW